MVCPSDRRCISTLRPLTNVPNPTLISCKEMCVPAPLSRKCCGATSGSGSAMSLLSTLLPTTAAGPFSPMNLSRMNSLPASLPVVTFNQARDKARSYCGPDGKYLLPPSQPDTDCWGRPEPRHNEGGNVAWIDGHVKWMRLSQFYTGQIPPDRFFT